MKTNGGELPWRLFKVSEVDEMAKNPELSALRNQDLQSLTATTTWLREFLAKPHPDLGRPGPVCPWIPRALVFDSIWLAVVHIDDPSPEKIREFLLAYGEKFQVLDPVDGDSLLYKATLLIFPDLDPRLAPQLIDDAQKLLKESFVKRALMIGEFHTMNRAPGLHNPNFFPLRSPIPMLAIRFMVEQDVVFLMRTEDAAEVRIGYLKPYLQRFAAILPDERLAVARAALRQAEQEVR